MAPPPRGAPRQASCAARGAAMPAAAGTVRSAGAKGQFGGSLTRGNFFFVLRVTFCSFCRCQTVTPQTGKAQTSSETQCVRHPRKSCVER